MFGLPSKAERRADAAYQERQAKDWTTKAADYGRKSADHHRQARTSGDSAADRAIARQHEENRRVCEANARDAARMAQQSRRRF